MSGGIDGSSTVVEGLWRSIPRSRSGQSPASGSARLVAHLSGGPGDDIIHATSTADRVDCGSGVDIVYAHRGTSIKHCEIVRYR